MQQVYIHQSLVQKFKAQMTILQLSKSVQRPPKKFWVLLIAIFIENLQTETKMLKAWLGLEWVGFNGLKT